MVLVGPSGAGKTTLFPEPSCNVSTTHKWVK
ncbi:hypothetical protein O9929_27335 [Vibrio lentus]|nr:hypothetical protein [Vibrio lentus]